MDILLIVLAFVIGLPLLTVAFFFFWFKWVAPRFFRESRKMFDNLGRSFNERT